MRVNIRPTETAGIWPRRRRAGQGGGSGKKSAKNPIWPQFAKRDREGGSQRERESERAIEKKIVHENVLGRFFLLFSPHS